LAKTQKSHLMRVESKNHSTRFTKEFFYCTAFGYGFWLRLLTTASNSFNKFEKRGILGWSIMLVIDLFMWRFPRDRKFLDSEKKIAS